jgi:glucosamine-6-phosphate deaminase
MEVIIQPNAEAVGRYAARVVTRVMRGRLAPVLGLATGTTPLPLYQELIRLHREEALDFGACSTFNLDEYVGLPARHPQSYRSFMQEHLLSRINVSPGARAHPGRHGGRYRHRLRRLRGGHPESGWY